MKLRKENAATFERIGGTLGYGTVTRLLESKLGEMRPPTAPSTAPKTVLVYPLRAK